MRATGKNHKKAGSWLWALGTLLALGCGPEEPSLGRGDTRLVGTWQLHERSTYVDTVQVVEQVPATPAQSLHFTEDGRITAEGEKLIYYRSASYYRLDSAAGTLRLTFVLDRLNGDYQQYLSIRNDSMTLLPPCEGECYLKLVRRR